MTDKFNIQQKLLAIQTELKVPKTQYNSFGKYNYRNCEGIVEAAKPLCQNHNALLTISDSLIALNGAVYVVACASLRDTESAGLVECQASAREATTQKGMNDAQITGSTSSYARKYALNGLFCIDDTKDDDFHNTSDNNTDKKPVPTTPTVITGKQIEFRKWMGDHKKRLSAVIGDDTLYYSTLGSYGYEKSSQVPEKDMKAISQAILKEVRVCEKLEAEGGSVK